MNDKIYTIELLYQGKYESWDFKDPVARNDLFTKAKEKFSEFSLDEENEDIDDLAIVQLSASSLRVKEDGDVAQRVPYEWFEGRVFRDMLAFINEDYNNMK
ncbi:hypothetical protein [Planococcus lenghuensis]|uniref:Uncharacterized protein n=1 Tax=Planococcus lenghuensis TaxID=2213202 RepID=A0A1Q2KZH9_9BACL|nr:hypothetical protein [Planococcus lenghuensis]AQQ53534.1 hypothetical protein B0X71_10925 [Planococcus lenghuensis]